MPARLQVLYLPPDRFGLVLDQAEELPEGEREALRAFGDLVGAQGVFVTSCYIDVAAQYDEQPEPTFLAVPMPPPAPAPEPPKLPPPNTTEGKAARIWGGAKGEDPRNV